MRLISIPSTSGPGLQQPKPRFCSATLPETRQAQARTLNAVTDKVAGKLGNTRTICRKCYIHPAVLDAWIEGRLFKELASLNIRQTPKGYAKEEFLILRWLERLRSRSPH